MAREWRHNELAEDLGDAKQTNMFDVPLGAVYLERLKQANTGHGIEGNSLQRADVIEIKPSYNRFCVAIYEIKVSRQDFLKDFNFGKWRGYLDYCHRFYFAAPAGMVKKEELPPEAGLIVRGDRGWQTQKAAPPREVEIPYFTLLSMIFSKQRKYFMTRERNRVYDAHQWWHVHREKLYKELGKNICDALLNRDKYLTAKESFTHAKEQIEETIKEALGVECKWPDWELERLARQIKEKAGEAV